MLLIKMNLTIRQIVQLGNKTSYRSLSMSFLFRFQAITVSVDHPELLIFDNVHGQELTPSGGDGVHALDPQYLGL